MLIQGDILNLQEPIKFICHQVNCKGKMAKGLALQIRNKYPEVYNDYMKEFKNNNLGLGKVIITKIDNFNYIISLCTQDDYKKNMNENKCYTDYKALNTAIEFLYSLQNNLLNKGKISLFYFPYNYGCGLAGGDWNVVQLIIKKYLNPIFVEYKL